MSKRINEDGVVAIFVTLIIMIILSVVTIGMVLLSSREQRQALDKQLSTQAFYAAESGINDVLNYETFTNGSTNYSNPDCGSASGSGNALDINVDAKADQPPANKLFVDPLLASAFGINLSGTNNYDQQFYTSYTCPLVINDPADLEYAQVSPDKAAVADIHVHGGNGSITQLVVGWEDYQSGTQFRTPAQCNIPSNAIFTNGSSWGPVPVLKIDITDLIDSSNTNFHRQDQLDNTATYYLVPCAASGAETVISWQPGTTNGGNNIGQVVNGECDSNQPSHIWNIDQPLRCNVLIGDVNGGGNPIPGATDLLVRIKPLYGTARITLYGLDHNQNNHPVHLNNVQTVIDVTGRATDVLKRQQVRVGNAIPYLYAVDSNNGVCKRLSVVDPTMPAVGSNVTTYSSSNVPALNVNLDRNICDPTKY